MGQGHMDMADTTTMVFTIWAKGKRKPRLHPRLKPITDITIIEDTMEAITDIPDTTDTYTTVGKPIRTGIRRSNQSKDLTNQKISTDQRETQHHPLHSVTFLNPNIPI